MKRIRYGGFFLVFLIFLTISQGWCQEVAGPRIIIDRKYFDAGQVKEGQIIEHVFAVRNTGNRPLEIKSLRPG